MLAEDRQEQRRVVLKSVPGARRDALARTVAVLREAGSPHLPDALGLIEAEGSSWLATSFVDGASLANLQAGLAPLPGLRVIRGLAHALAALHQAGTHHGDVSAANVVRTSTGGVVLVDFGHLDRLACGTPGYLAPESLAGGGGPAADLFALGCLWFRLLFGEVPWTRPEAVVRLDRETVLARVQGAVEAGGVAIGIAARRLLEQLLDPDPRARPSVLAVLTRVEHLEAALAARLEAAPPPVWRLPSRWPWRGPGLDGPAANLIAGRTRLLLVVGPAGAGRGRALDELETRVAAAGGAWVREAEEAPEVVLDAWLAGESGVFAAGSPWRGDEQLATRIVAAVGLARRPLVLAVDPGLAAAIEARRTGGIERIDLEPADASTLAGWVGLARPEVDVDAWVRALTEATEGWPGRALRALEGAARAQVDVPEPHRLAAWAGELPWMAPVRARRVMEARWGLGGADSPTAGEVLRARATLGERLVPLAREVIGARRASEEPPLVELAMDAQLPARLEEGAWEASGSVAHELLEWVRSEPGRFGARARIEAGRVALASGDHALARALVDGLPTPAARILDARALQRCGEAAEAGQVLEVLAEGGSLEARGFQVRSLVDLGDASHARALGEAALAKASPEVEGAAVLALWTGYACLASGGSERGEGHLRRALESLEGLAGRRHAGTRARVRQLLGNAAQARGELALASDHLDAASAAYGEAGEAGSSLLVEAALASLAQAAARPADAVERGRRALRGLLVRGHSQSLAAVLGNLVTELVRTECLDEAEHLLASVKAATAEADGLVAARIRRAELTLALGRRTGGPAVVTALLECAQDLAKAGAGREALDARCAAASALRRSGELRRARALLARYADGDPLDDVELETERAAAWVALALAVLERGEEPEAEVDLRRWMERLASVGSPKELWCRGSRAAALTIDRTTLSWLGRRLAPGDPRRRALALRITQRVEAILSDAHEMDRAAVRRSLLTEAGDPAPLRQLLAELEPGGSAGAPVVPAATEPPPEGSHSSSLIRIYRRLAREEDLERLLEQVVDAIMELTDAERGAVVVVPEGEGPRLEVVRELAGEGDVSFSRSVIEQVLSKGSPVLSLDAARDERFDTSRSIHHLNLRSVLAIPLRFRGVLLGAAYVDHRLRRGAFDESDLRRVEDFADLAALAVAHARALARARADSEALEAQRARLAELLEQRELEVAGLRERVRLDPDAREGYRGLIGAAPQMQALYRLIDRLGDSSVPVVIHGESGTGKELVAQAIHGAGHRRDRPFVAENCGAIPETLLESVLFGHAKGAFTGAQRARPGLFEAADGGTMFLDEVGEMSPAMQTKLLRVLQEGEVRRVGETASRKVDVRLIAASNRDLERMVAEGTFRRDLFYRICVVRTDLPALRERRTDIPALVDHFLRRHGAEHLEVSAAAQRRLARYAWPGNVRELENEVQRWGALVEARVQVEDLAPPIRDADAAEAEDPDDLRLKPRVERMERVLIARAMARTEGNQTQAAQLLGLSRYGLQKKLKRLEQDGVDLTSVLAG